METEIKEATAEPARGKWAAVRRLVEHCKRNPNKWFVLADDWPLNRNFSQSHYKFDGMRWATVRNDDGVTKTAQGMWPDDNPVPADLHGDVVDPSILPDDEDESVPVTIGRKS